MSNIMKTRCPHCTQDGAHPVTKTDPILGQYYDHRSEKRLKRDYNHGLSYRSHTRRCKNCGLTFQTCEMALKDLQNIMFLWAQDEYTINVYKSLREDDKDRFSRLVNNFDSFLKRRGFGRIQSLTQEVGMLGIEIGYDTVKKLRDTGVYNLAEILVHKKSALTSEDCLSEEQWKKLADLFAESGLKLEDDSIMASKGA